MARYVDVAQFIKNDSPLTRCMSLPCVVSALHSWAEPAARERLLESYFEPADRPYAHLWLDVHTGRGSVEWLYQFMDLGMCFKLSRRFSLAELC